ncbi:NADH-quinone oxidoreductase subunit L [Peribacillus kribbensis]|uniref:NADH-quinone oxidoreductase subunit L n=1 Tax=Peribacillus kribbensis TaxID=356658 RepID=UPI00047889CD|nr:NADH-quinone oxidoreductase subunit L [Peribacillus kribbensis]
MMEIAWIIPLFPLLSFLLLLAAGRVLKEKSAYIGILLTLCSFLFSVLVLWGRIRGDTYKAEADWLNIGEAHIKAGFEVNQLNALMLVIVSLVSFLVHLYSKGYMQREDRLPVFYAYLGLFTFAMLGLVISPNLLQLYIFWELVGLGSFLLIGFYFYKEEAKAAAKKAFIMTRIGDVGLFIGMILLFWKTGSFDFQVIFQEVEGGGITQSMITLTAILIFIGAMGKSGQFPLHTWLPDAMEGPTPVSALIHAATMVAAGVYLVAAMYPLFLASTSAMLIVASIGGLTAIFAASIGLVQRDIKRILAYSTVSQLGYMMLALGTGGYTAGVFHLMTHAFFKALLFLAAGSVIHAVHTQDVEEMGGLWKKLRITGPVFLIGTLAISGVPLFSGFFSKDEILSSAWENGNYVLFGLAVIAAFFTAFYMFRLFFLVFSGRLKKQGVLVHESPRSMTFPMIILAVLAVISGYINTPWFGTFLGSWLTEGNPYLEPEHRSGPVWIMGAATLVSLAGIALAYLIYRRNSISREWLGGEGSFLHTVLYNKYYVDEFYQGTIVWLTGFVSIFLSYIDRFIVEGLVNGIAASIHKLGRLLSRFQTGQTQHYGAIAFLGLAVLVIIFALTGGMFG